MGEEGFNETPVQRSLFVSQQLGCSILLDIPNCSGVGNQGEHPWVHSWHRGLVVHKVLANSNGKPGVCATQPPFPSPAVPARGLGMFGVSRAWELMQFLPSL